MARLRFSCLPVLSLILCCMAMLLTMGGCVADSPAGSDTESTGSPNSTSVRNQGYFGFCWSYALMAMIESMYKKKTGNEIALSPEALGFYRLHITLESIVRRAQTEKASKARALEIFKFSWEEGYWTQDALTLIRNVGVVPESAWNIKVARRRIHFNKHRRSSPGNPPGELALRARARR